jgi:GT2 family glycosyltransferase
MKQSPVLLSIIIVSYNTRELLEKCLDSVIKSLSRHPDPAKGGAGGQDLPTEIIVVDNHSQDNTVTWLKKYIKASAKIRSKIGVNLSLIANNENLGFAKANNQGIKIAEGKYIMLLNSDTIVKDRALEKMVSFLEKRKEFAILGPKLLNADGTPQPSLGKFPTLPVVAAMLFLEHFLPASFLRVRWSPKNEREGDWVMGAALLLRREVYEKIGGLDENIFMYMEEVEWCFRAKKAGFRVYFYPQAEIIHLGRGSSKSGKKEPILQIFRGLIYFYEKHQPFWQKGILLFLLKLKASLSYLLGILTNNSYLKKTYGEAKKIT